MEQGLTIDWKVLIGQFINFAILFFILKKIAYGPFLALMKKRREDIENGLNKAKEAEENLNKIREVKEKADKENEERKKQIIFEAENQGKKRIEEALILAEKEKEAILLKAQKDAQLFKESEKERSKKILIENAFILTESILKENIDEEKNRKIVEEFLGKIWEKKKK